MGTVSVPHVPASAGQVRRQLSNDLRARHIRSTVVDEAVLLVTELVGNSVRHARALPDGRILVGWHIDGGRLQIRVTDGGSLLDEPHVAHAGPRDTRGRGLSIVDSLASLWGVERSNGSTTVWATLPVHTPAQRHQTRRHSSSADAVGNVGSRQLSDA